MKKLIKATAMLLAVTMTLTACQGENPTQPQTVQSLEKEYTAYLNAAVTEVEDKPFTLNGMKGTYSGDWKGNRPEGEGTFWLNDNEYYYSENWVNGDINGQGEIRRLGSDGKVRFYTGECVYSEPFGQGTMEIGEDGDEFRTVIDGDFSDSSGLLYFTLNAEGRCTNIGGYINGEYESYVNNPDVTGMEFLVERTPIGGAAYKSRTGYYIGQVNEAGLPDGYGYYSEQYETEGGIYLQLNSVSYQTLGSWKDGKVEGYFSDVILSGDTITETETGFWGNKKETKYNVTNSTKREGFLKRDKLVGTYSISTTVESDPPRPLADGAVVTTMNYDTNIKMVERFDIDGSHTYEWQHMLSETYSDEGEFAKFNKDGKMTIHKTLNDGKWTELMDLEREEREERERMIKKGAKIALAGLTIVGVFVALRGLDEELSRGADQMVANAHARADQSIIDRNKYNDYKKEAEDAIRSGRYDDARKLYDDAKQYEYAVAWWDQM